MFQQVIKNSKGSAHKIIKLWKYCRVYRELIRMQIHVQFTYSFNLLCGLSAELGWVIAKLVYSFVIFSTVPEDRGLYFLLIGIYFTDRHLHGHMGFQYLPAFYLYEKRSSGSLSV